MGAPTNAPHATAFSRLVSTLSEDSFFAFASGGAAPRDTLDAMAKRRHDAYMAVLSGIDALRMTTDCDRWIIDMTRTLATACPPVFFPMHEVLREKVTLEVGARGLRSLFSSKPSDKDVQRVKRLGTLAVRILRSVYAADGPIDAEEARTVAALIGALGLPEADGATLAAEPPKPVESLDVYGEIEAGIVRGLVRGAWHAAAADSLDPREESVVRAVGTKLGMTADAVEAARADVLARVETLRTTGLAAVEAIRFVLADAHDKLAERLATVAATLLIPRRYREEALAQIRHGAPIALAKRHASLAVEDRTTVLGMTWAAAISEDPTVSRKMLLRWRYDRFAADLGDDGARSREAMEDWLGESVAALTRALP
ncbi:MAG: hypothetical protein U0169_20950 [Polyangiaceae bacterium]